MAANDVSRPGNRSSADLVSRVPAFATGLRFASARAASEANRRNACTGFRPRVPTFTRTLRPCLPSFWQLVNATLKEIGK